VVALKPGTIPDQGRGNSGRQSGPETLVSTKGCTKCWRFSTLAPICRPIRVRGAKTGSAKVGGLKPDIDDRNELAGHAVTAMEGAIRFCRRARMLGLSNALRLRSEIGVLAALALNEPD